MNNLIDKTIYSTCSGEDFAKILNQYKDKNDCDVIDILVCDVDEILHFQSRNNIDPDNDFESHLTRAENLQIKIIAVGYFVDDRVKDFVTIRLNMPEGGCYRCSQMFLIKDYNE